MYSHFLLWPCRCEKLENTRLYLGKSEENSLVYKLVISFLWHIHQGEYIHQGWAKSRFIFGRLNLFILEHEELYQAVKGGAQGCPVDLLAVGSELEWPGVSSTDRCLSGLGSLNI